MPETQMQMPALAVVGSDHRIIRSTEAFRRRYDDAEKVREHSPELDLVLNGRADAATVTLGELSVEVEAVMDATGRRQAVLTLPPVGASPGSEPLGIAVREAGETSPAMVWLKDLDGRYLYANPRYLGDLDTSEERLLGNRDADLPETETVDGPRLGFAEDGLEEPLRLEYTVPAVGGRSALAAFRFPLHGEAGQPIATCGVAAPVDEVNVARDEAVRLMQLERWNRLDPDDVRAELLEEWHVQVAPPCSDEPENEGAARGEEPATGTELTGRLETAAREAEPVAAPQPDPPVSRLEPEQISRPYQPTPAPPPPTPSTPAAPSLSETAELLQTNLQLARKWADRAEQLQDELQDAQSRARQAESEAQQAQAAAARASEDADRYRRELELSRSELDQMRSELEHTEVDLQAARSELETVAGELGAARAQAEALRGPSAVAVRLSEDLGRAMAAERERSDELERMLARLRARLTDFETALDGAPAATA